MMSENQTSPLLIRVKNLKVAFPMDEGTVTAVEDVSFDLHRGEVMGMVGESGCGKSVTAQAIMRIIPTPGRIEQGELLLHRPGGRVVDLAQLNGSGKEMREIRGQEVAMIFQ